MVDRPQVWFVMPAYNTAAFIGEALASIAAQDYPGCQVAICAADGKTEKAASMALEGCPALADSVLMRQESDYAEAMNQCLHLAYDNGAEIVARLDSDDVQDGTRMSKQVALLTEGADCATCEMWVFGDGPRRDVICGPMIPGEYGSGGPNPCCGSIVAWAHVYRAVGGFDGGWAWTPDTDWNFRAVRIQGLKWSHVPEHLYGYRKHPGAMTCRDGGLGRQQHDDLRRLHLEWKDACASSQSRAEP